MCSKNETNRLDDVNVVSFVCLFVCLFVVGNQYHCTVGVRTYIASQQSNVTVRYVDKQERQATTFVVDSI